MRRKKRGTTKTGFKKLKSAHQPADQLDVCAHGVREKRPSNKKNAHPYPHKKSSTNSHRKSSSKQAKNPVFSVGLCSGLTTDLYVGQRKVTTLIDTGSSVTCIHEKLARRIIPLDKKPILIAANGTELEVLGKTRLVARSEKGLNIPIIGLVVRQLSCNILLGNDFNIRYKAIINLHESSYELFFPEKSSLKLRTTLIDKGQIAQISRTMDCATPLNIPARLNSLLTRIQFDTGSIANIVSHEYVKPEDIKPLKNVHLQMANQQPLRILGSTTLELYISGRKYHTDALVSENLTSSLLLGNAFIKKYVQIIDFGNNFILLTHQTTNENFAVRALPFHEKIWPPKPPDPVTTDVPPKSSETPKTVAATGENFAPPFVESHSDTPLMSGIEDWQPPFAEEEYMSETSAIPVKIMKDIVIPPYSTRTINCKLKHYHTTTFGLFQLGDGAVTAKKLFSPISVVDVAKYIRIVLRNTKHEPVKIFKGYTIGTIEPIDISYESVELPENEQISAVNSVTYTPHKLTEIAIEQRLEQKYQEKYKDIVASFSDVFLFSGDQFHGGCASYPPMRIELQDFTPVHKAPYRTGPHQRKIIKEYVEDMLRSSIIRPSTSNYSSPLLIIPKKEKGAWRPIIDFRQLNSKLKPQHFPISRVDDILASLSGSTIFSRFDIHQGFFNFKITEDSSKYTAFATHEGLWEFLVLPQGLSTSPFLFNRAMMHLFRPMIYKNLLIFYDDIFLYSKTKEEHAEALIEFFTLCRKANIKLKPKKCLIGMESIEVLGFIASASGISPDPQKVAALVKIPPPTNVKGIRSFCAAVSYYRHHLRFIAHHLEVLQRLTRKNATFEWSRDCQIAFDAIKKALSTAPILAHYTPEETTLELRIDASKSAIGAHLDARYADGTVRPLGFYSRTLTEAERIYSTPERELTAMVYGLEKFKSLIWNTPVTIFTDNQGLSYLHTMQSPNMRMTKLMLKLSDFNYTLKWIPRSKNEFADYLSKNPADLQIPSDTTHVVGSATLKNGETPDASLNLTSLDMATEQRKDEDL